MPKWTDETIVMTLTLLNARAAARGRACPNAARVLARLEISHHIATSLADGESK